MSDKKQPEATAPEGITVKDIELICDTCVKHNVSAFRLGGMLEIHFREAKKDEPEEIPQPSKPKLVTDDDILMNPYAGLDNNG